MSKKKVILSDRIYVPIKFVENRDEMTRKYTQFFFDESICRGCESYRDRPNCALDCEKGGLEEAVCLVNTKNIKGVQYMGFPMGTKEYIEKQLGLNFNQFKLVDKRSKHKFDYPVKFTAELRDYQVEVYDDWNESGFGLVKAPPRSGKCTHPDTYVHGNFGFVTLRELFAQHNFHENGGKCVIGDGMTVRSRHGEQSVSHFYRKVSQQLFKIRTHNGYEIKCTPEHPLLVCTESGKHEWLRADQLTKSHHLCINRDTKDLLFPQEAYVVGKHKMTRRLARLMGYLVADGGVGASVIRFESSYPLRVRNIAKILDRYKVEYTTSVTENGLYALQVRKSTGKWKMLEAKLFALGFKFTGAANKEIPFGVRASKLSHVKEFLTAYFSCDSYFASNGREVELSSASSELIDQLHYMLTAFGVVGRKTTKKKQATNSSNPTLRDYHYISLNRKNGLRLIDAFAINKPQVEEFLKAGEPRPKNDIVPNMSKCIEDLRSKSLNGGAWENDSGERVTASISPDLYRTCNSDGHATVDMLSRIDRNEVQRVSKDAYDALCRIDDELDYLYDPISLIECDGEYNDEVLDISVPFSRSFTANGIMSHNTVMSLKILLDMGYRVLIIADQKDFLDGFYETIEVMTNLPELEKKAGKKLFGFLEKEEDFENFQVGLSTYQKFLHNTDKRMKMINANFGSLWTDEIHRAGANCFSKFLISCKQLNRGGCSATPKRKDGRHKLVFKIIGPVVAETTVDTLIPECRVYPVFSTNPRRQFQGGPASWVYMNKFLCKNKERNQMILEQAIADIENGRSVVIPLLYRDHIDWMVKNINEHFDRTGNHPVAAAFVGGQKEKKKRKEIIDKAREYKIKCVVGIRSLLQLGLNVPRWDTLYYALPMSNRENWEQESARILTPDVNNTGKKKPLIRMYFDPGVNQSIGCFKTTLGFSEDQKFKFKSASKMKALMFNIPIGLREGSVKMGGASTNSFFAPTEDEIPRSNVVGRNALF